MRMIFTVFSIMTLMAIPNLALAETIQIEFTAHDSYSSEVILIDAGDTVEWLPTNKGHNVEFLSGPNMNTLPKKSEIDAFHSVIFTLPGLYLYQCTPHGNIGMLGLIVVDKGFYNLEIIKSTPLPYVADPIMKRLIKIAKSKAKLLQ